MTTQTITVQLTVSIATTTSIRTPIQNTTGLRSMAWLDRFVSIHAMGLRGFLAWIISAASALAATSLENRLKEFYQPDVVQTIRLDVSSRHLRELKEALPKRIFVPTTFKWNGVELTNVGIRYKGDSSSDPRSPHKRSFLIKFPELVKGQRFLGLRQVALDNAIQFGGLFSERLITDILRDLDVPISRCNYARVYLNDEYVGIYVNVERVDESFLKSRFGNDSGRLFKVDKGGPGADLQRFSENPVDYMPVFELDAGSKTGAYQGLLEFIRSLNQPGLPESNRSFESVFKVDPFLKTMSVLLLAGAFDQYTGWGPHNYYLYQDPSDLRWTYIPWDLDVGFADHAFGRVPVLDGWNAAWPVPVAGRPLLERVVTDPALLARYRKEASSILEKYFQPDVLIPKLRALHAQIRGHLEQDPFRPRRVTNPKDVNYDAVVKSMEEFIRRRYELARAQLANPGPRPETKDQPAGGAPPTPGKSSKDSPSELQIVHAAPGRIELKWKDNAEGEVAFIIQKSRGEPDLEFQNAIGLPGENLTSGIDSDVKPGVTYRYRLYAIRSTPNGPEGTGVSNVVKVTVPEK